MLRRNRCLDPTVRFIMSFVFFTVDLKLLSSAQNLLGDSASREQTFDAFRLVILLTLDDSHPPQTSIRLLFVGMNGFTPVYGTHSNVFCPEEVQRWTFRSPFLNGCLL